MAPLPRTSAAEPLHHTKANVIGTRADGDEMASSAYTSTPTSLLHPLYGGITHQGNDIRKGRTFFSPISQVAKKKKKKQSDDGAGWMESI